MAVVLSGLVNPVYAILLMTKRVVKRECEMYGDKRLMPH
jgi:hypothetical protein